MFWIKKQSSEDTDGIAGEVAAVAEGLYLSGKMHCAEAVLSALKTTFAPQVPDEVIRMAGGFGGGSGAGCICGAVAGGTMGFGIAVDGDRKTTAALTRQLHTWFKQEYRATCCKVVSANGKGGCGALTGRVAGKAADLLLERGYQAAKKN